MLQEIKNEIGPSLYEKQAAILQTWVTVNNLLCFFLLLSPLWHPVRLQAKRLQPQVFRRGRGRGRRPLREEVATLTEGVWKISSFSRLLQDVCSAFIQLLLRSAVDTVTGCHGRGSDKCLPGSPSPLLCEDCIWMSVFVLLRVSECVHAPVCVLPPTSQIKGWKLRPGHLNSAHPGCPAGLGNELQILPLARGQNQRFTKAGHTMLCIQNVSKQLLSLSFWIKICVFFCLLHFSDCGNYIPQPSKPDVKKDTEAWIAKSRTVLLGLIQKSIQTTDYSFKR